MATISLSINAILVMAQALPELDGFKKNGDIEAYDFDNGTRWNIGKNYKVLRAEVDTWEETRVAKVKELSAVNQDVSKETPAVQTAFRDWSNDFRKTVVEVNGLKPLKRSKLLVNSNPIPGTVISALMPLIEDDCDHGDTAPAAPAVPAK